MARPAAPFVLTLADAEILQGWLRMTSLPQSLAQRARILLRLADGQSPKEISEQLQISAPVVYPGAESHSAHAAAQTWADRASNA